MGGLNDKTLTRDEACERKMGRIAFIWVEGRDTDGLVEYGDG